MMRNWFRLNQSAHGWSRWFSCGAIVLFSLSPVAVPRGLSQASPSSPSGLEAPNPAPPERPTLQSGSQGAVVTELQATLKLLGYYSGLVDGLYGKNTSAAVAQFQQAAGLPADGIVGSTTWERLLPAAPSFPVAEPASRNAIPSAPPDRTEATLPVLKLGMKGSAVEALQTRLQAIGLFVGTVDGVFGPETQAAVKSAQERFGLEPDGIVGPATWSTLLRQAP